MWIVGAPPKKLEKSSALRVALIKINLKSRRRGRRSFNTINRKSIKKFNRVKKTKEKTGTIYQVSLKEAQKFNQIYEEVYLHSCLAHEFHQQKHGLYHSGCGRSTTFEAKYHWYRKVDGYFFLSFPPIELYSQPNEKSLLWFSCQMKELFKWESSLFWVPNKQLIMLTKRTRKQKGKQGLLIHPEALLSL